MSTAIKAYHARMLRNHHTIMSIADELKEKGCSITLPSSELVSYIKIEKEGKKGIFGFAQVPYRWYVKSEFRGPFEYNLDTPFTAEQIINSLV